MAAKTAEKKAVKASAPKEVLSADKVISVIRSHRAGGLFVANMEYVDVLLAEYEETGKQNLSLSTALLNVQDGLERADKLLEGKQTALDLANGQLESYVNQIMSLQRELAQTQEHAASHLRELVAAKQQIAALQPAESHEFLQVTGLASGTRVKELQNKLMSTLLPEEIQS